MPQFQVMMSGKTLQTCYYIYYNTIYASSFKKSQAWAVRILY